jgi:hypothetical protein
MAEVQETVQETVGKVQDKVSGASGKQVLTAAAAAAATTAATYAVKRAVSHGDSGRSNGNSGSNVASESKRRASGLVASAAATSWDAAAEILLPVADDAAEAAGKYVATHGPEILRERIIPKFIEAFNDAA